MKKSLLFFITLLCSAATTSPLLDNQETTTISEQCYKDLTTIKTDVFKLKYYCQGVFQGIGEMNDPTLKPSDIINWLLQEPSTDERTDLQYVPASFYLSHFAKEQNGRLDEVFSNKYAETQDVQKTWTWFNDYFAEEVLRKPTSKCLQRMVEDDHERIELAKQGITFSSDGKTAFINGFQAEKYYDSQK